MDFRTKLIACKKAIIFFNDGSNFEVKGDKEAGIEIIDNYVHIFIADPDDTQYNTYIFSMSTINFIAYDKVIKEV